MASSSSQDVEPQFAIASRRAKVRSARANRAVNQFSCRGVVGEEGERDAEGGESHPHIPKHDHAVVLVESNDVRNNDASPKPIIRGLNKDKRPVARGAHGGKSNKGVRDRRKLREKRRSTAIGVMHMPSTESTGDGSTGEDVSEENEDKYPAHISKLIQSAETEEKVHTNVPKRKSESDLDADDEAAQDSSEVKTHSKDDTILLKLENQRLTEIIETKDRRIAMLEIQVTQLTKQMDEIKEKLLSAVKSSS